MDGEEAGRASRLLPVSHGGDAATWQAFAVILRASPPLSAQLLQDRPAKLVASIWLVVARDISCVCMQRRRAASRATIAGDAMLGVGLHRVASEYEPITPSCPGCGSLVTECFDGETLGAARSTSAKGVRMSFLLADCLTFARRGCIDPQCVAAAAED